VVDLSPKSTSRSTWRPKVTLGVVDHGRHILVARLTRGCTSFPPRLLLLEISQHSLSNVRDGPVRCDRARPSRSHRGGHGHGPPVCRGPWHGPLPSSSSVERFVQDCRRRRLDWSATEWDVARASGWLLAEPLIRLGANLLVATSSSPNDDHLAMSWHAHTADDKTYVISSIKLKTCSTLRRDWLQAVSCK